MNGLFLALGRGELLELLVLALFFLGAPLAKAIADSRKKAQRRAGRPTPPRRLDQGAGADVPRRGEPSGRELWEQLLRGEVAAPPPPVPAPALEPPPPAPVPVPSRPPSGDPAWSEVAPEGGSLEGESYDEQARTGRVEPLARPLRDLYGLPTRAAQAQARAAEAALAAVPLPQTAGAALGAAPPMARRRATPVSRWRRGIVLAEVLGPPLALRGPGGLGASPEGLR